MVIKEETKKTLPPYLPYKALIKFINGLKGDVPNRVDRNLIDHLPGFMPYLVISALEYLGLVIPKTGISTEALFRMVQAEGTEREGILKGIILSSYAFLFEDGFDLEAATPQELRDRFSQTGARGDTLRKCIAFFLKAAKDAGMTLSPQIKMIPGPKKGTKQKRKKRTAQEKKEGRHDAEGPPAVEDPSREISLEKIILDKFPPFNPEWSTEVQMKWFEGFDRLTERFKKKSDGKGMSG
jgi:hypothetical protein